MSQFTVLLKYCVHVLIEISLMCSNIFVSNYRYICLTRKGNTTIIEAPFLGSGCGLGCWANGVGSNPVEGRTKI